MFNFQKKLITLFFVLFITTNLIYTNGLSQTNLRVFFDKFVSTDIATLSFADNTIRRHILVNLEGYDISNAKLAFYYANSDGLYSDEYIANGNFHVEVDGNVVGTYTNVVNQIFERDTLEINSYVLGKDSILISFINDVIHPADAIAISGVDLIINGTTSIKVFEEGQVIPDFNLSQNYPNPFNPSTTIKYSLRKPDRVILQIYDLLGNHIKNLKNEYQISGNYEVNWDGKNELGEKVASGTYIYNIKVGNIIISKKMLLIK